MSQSVEVVGIPTEQDAYRLLGRILDGTVDAARITIDYSSANWATFDLKLKGANYNSTLNSDLMRALIEYQNTLYRVTAYVRSGRLNAAAIDDNCRARLRLDFKVSNGSSEVFAEAIKAVSEMVGKVASGMGPKAKLTISLTAILLIFGSPTVGLWMEHHYEAKKEQLASDDHKSDLDVLKTAMSVVANSEKSVAENQKILIQALSSSTHAVEIQKQAANATAEVMRQSSDADEVRFQGTTISGEAIRIFTDKKRRSGEDVRLNGVFKVEAADSTGAKGFVCRVRRLSDDVILQATMMDALMAERDREIVQKAFWDKSNISLVIRARQVGSDYKNAEIVTAQIISN